MYQKERIDSIVDILKKNGYVTVKQLTDELHYSTATINRDLNYMQKQKLIKRSYGGVELIKRRGVPLMFRYNKMRVAKNKIARVAAKYIKDGDTIFMDGSTTTQYLSKYITEKKDLTVITNNMALVSYLCEYGINVVCMGGRVIEKPYILCSEETVENAMRYKVDKFFFSTGVMTTDGKIAITAEYPLLLDIVVTGNAKETFFLADHEKIGEVPKNGKILYGFDKVTYIVTDYIFSDEVKGNYPDTQFIEVE